MCSPLPLKSAKHAGHIVMCIESNLFIGLLIFLVELIWLCFVFLLRTKFESLYRGRAL